MKQVQAVVNAVSTVLGDDFTVESTNVNEVITNDQKQEVREIVLNGILNGSVDYKGPTSDEDALRRYVNGMVDNHFRKSRLLNGGNVYKPSSSGSKRDAQLRELNRLLKTLDSNSDDAAKVRDHINKRTKELQQERDKRSLQSSRAKIDTSVIPDHLAQMLETNG